MRPAILEPSRLVAGRAGAGGAPFEVSWSARDWEKVRAAQ
jgi:hypothetical protein